MNKVFVELGACYFDNLDKLLLDGWTGYFIEPVPHNMAKLIKKVQGRIGDAKVKANFESAVISNYDGIGEISFVSNDNLQPWVDGIAHVSSKPHVALKEHDEREFLKENLVKLKTRFMTFDSFINKYNIKNIDVLKVDVEGHELDILNSYSWKIKPKHIKIEHAITGKAPLLDILKNHGYNSYYDDEDIFAFYEYSSYYGDEDVFAFYNGHK